MPAPESSSSLDWYAAGLIDGEGYIGISHLTGSDTYAIRVQVAMVTKGTSVLKRLRSEYGGRIGTRPPETERNAAKDVWLLDGAEAYSMLMRIRDHLILKAVPADCAIELWESILRSREQRGRKHWNDSLRRHARHLMLRLQEANARGPQDAMPEPGADAIAVWRWGEWWQPEESIFGPVPFTDRFPMSGRMVDGVIYPA